MSADSVIFPNTAQIPLLQQKSQILKTIPLQHFQLDEARKAIFQMSFYRLTLPICTVSYASEILDSPPPI